MNEGSPEMNLQGARTEIQKLRKRVQEKKQKDKAERGRENCQKHVLQFRACLVCLAWVGYVDKSSVQRCRNILDQPKVSGKKG